VLEHALVCAIFLCLPPRFLRAAHDVPPRSKALRSPWFSSAGRGLALPGVGQIVGTLEARNFVERSVGHRIVCVALWLFDDDSRGRLGRIWRGQHHPNPLELQRLDASNAKPWPVGHK
jgi:hypothetical protein